MLRDYQRTAVDRIVGACALGQPRQLVVSPTGSGKSYVLGHAFEELSAAKRTALTAPSIEILQGIASKMGWDSGREALEARGLFTIKRLHNVLMSGEVAPFEALLFDEAHHVDNTHDVVWQLCGRPFKAGLTATPYRGTPAETARLHDEWGDPFVALTLKDAVARGVIARPDFVTWPLVDDDVIDIVNGEFAVTRIDKSVREAADDLIERCRGLHDGTLWRRATIFRVSSVDTASFIAARLEAAGLPALAVTGSTSDADRARAFRATAFDRTHALVQVKVVGEGVDLPYRVMVDLAPTMSPLFWQQAVGRITRPAPDEPPPVYYATNHNLTRHAYLWQGLIPAGQIRESQLAWGPKYKPKRRHLSRAIGLEGFGQFAVTGVPLADGSYASLYTLQTPDGLHQYAVMLHPCLQPCFYERSNTHTGNLKKKTLDSGAVIEYKEKDYGPWRKIPAIPDATGYVSTRPGRITDTMRAWWKRSAKSRGLDETIEPDNRQFQLLPILFDTRQRIRVT